MYELCNLIGSELSLATSSIGLLIRKEVSTRAFEVKGFVLFVCGLFCCSNKFTKQKNKSKFCFVNKTFD